VPDFCADLASNLARCMLRVCWDHGHTVRRKAPGGRSKIAQPPLPCIPAGRITSIGEVPAEKKRRPSSVHFLNPRPTSRPPYRLVVPF
jgi:hypothetical protein